MGKSWIFALLTLTIALGLIGLLAYTSESVHHTAEPAPAITEREMGPTLHRNGLMLTH
ncbi:MAG TPA: hypothetical protein VK878_15080 [Candidatus Deferrimicrobiaceae bacterium]|nr:hypothetical protein [Candidatus Deferrimicrobiaceae bacterium]